MNDYYHCLSLLNEFEDFYGLTVNMVQAEAKSGDNAAQEAVMKEMADYAAVYKAYFAASEDLRVRRQKRQEDFERQQRSLDFQIQMAQDTLDFNLPRHKQGLREGEDKLEQLERSMNLQQEAADKRLEQYMPISRALEARGVDVDCPFVSAADAELRFRNTALRKKSEFVSVHKEALVDDE